MKYFVSLCVLFPLVVQYSSALVVPDKRLLARVEIEARADPVISQGDDPKPQGEDPAPKAGAEFGEGVQTAIAGAITLFTLHELDHLVRHPPHHHHRSMTTGPEVDVAGAAIGSGLLSARAANLPGHSKRFLGMGPKLSSYAIPIGLTTTFLTFNKILHRAVERRRFG